MRLQQQAHCQLVVVGAHNLTSVLLDGFDRLVARSRDIDSDLRVELLFALYVGCVDSTGIDPLLKSVQVEGSIDQRMTILNTMHQNYGFVKPTLGILR